MNKPPAYLDNFRVIEYGFFRSPILPKGYVPPPNGKALLPVQNLAICTAKGVTGFYLRYCTPDWHYVTYLFNETMEHTKENPVTEFGQDVIEWKKA